MASKKEELKNEIANIQEETEAEVSRLADLKDAVVDALATNDASAREVAVVGLNVMLDAVGHMFGEMNAKILADVINQVVTQFGDHPLAAELIERARGKQWVN
jgi:hypothetical protein